MISRPSSLEKLLSLLRSLPSLGPKMSERIAHYLLKMSEEQMNDLLQTIQETYQKVRPCPICGHWDDSSPCRICQDTSRNEHVICVVEDSKDLIAMSRVQNFHGVYHVLGGVLSPLEGIGPQDLRIDSLLKRLETGKVREVILALNPDMEGETTSEYLTKQIQNISQKLENHENESAYQIKVTRLAQGLPIGSELEYTDELTLTHAFEDRKDVLIIP